MMSLCTSAEQQPGADAQAGYFETNHRRMNYLELREDGWVIGSGMIESGAKQFQARIAGPGMRWSRDGAERLLPIRAAILGQQFDRRWNAIYNSPQNLNAPDLLMMLVIIELMYYNRNMNEFCWHLFRNQWILGVRS